MNIKEGTKELKIILPHCIMMALCNILIVKKKKKKVNLFLCILKKVQAIKISVSVPFQIKRNEVGRKK